jgi:bacteriocin-like protein
MSTEISELTDDELNAVSGGATIVPNRQTINARMVLGGVGGGGDVGAAIGAWNTLLGQYGGA